MKEFRMMHDSGSFQDRVVNTDSDVRCLARSRYPHKPHRDCGRIELKASESPERVERHLLPRESAPKSTPVERRMLGLILGRGPLCSETMPEGIQRLFSAGGHS